MNYCIHTYPKGHSLAGQKRIYVKTSKAEAGDLVHALASEGVTAWVSTRKTRKLKSGAIVWAHYTPAAKRAIDAYAHVSKTYKDLIKS